PTPAVVATLRHILRRHNALEEAARAARRIELFGYRAAVVQRVSARACQTKNIARAGTKKEGWGSHLESLRCSADPCIGLDGIPNGCRASMAHPASSPS